MLLYGVPFHYLVPDEEMLPAESIRFFYLNPEWINCLLQGACSVGRTSHTDELADQLLRARFFEVSEKLAFKLRSSAKQAADRRRDATEATKRTVPGAPPDAHPDAILHWPLSGYLLRSAAVESWIGLEARATGVDSAGNVLGALQDPAYGPSGTRRSALHLQRQGDPNRSHAAARSHPFRRREQGRRWP